MTLLAAVVAPLLAHPAKATHQAVCANNLRQLAQAFGIYAQQHNNQFPWMRTNNAPVGNYFIWAGAEIGNPCILTCPADSLRSPTRSFTNITGFNPGVNLSYLLNLKAQTHQAGAWLMGDRNHSIFGTITNSSGCAWVDNNNHGTEGNVVTVDGRVEFVNTPGLRAFIDRVLDQGYEIYLSN